jgi:hypothetical protein
VSMCVCVSKCVWCADTSFANRDRVSVRSCRRHMMLQTRLDIMSREMRESEVVAGRRPYSGLTPMSPEGSGATARISVLEDTIASQSKQVLRLLPRAHTHTHTRTHTHTHTHTYENTKSGTMTHMHAHFR